MFSLNLSDKMRIKHFLGFAKVCARGVHSEAPPVDVSLHLYIGSALLHHTSQPAFWACSQTSDGACVTALVHRQHSLASHKSTSLLGMLADIRWFSSATCQQQQASVTLQVTRATKCLHTVCCKLGTVGAVTRPIQACLIGSNPQRMCLLRFWAQASLALLPDQAGLLRNLQVHL